MAKVHLTMSLGDYDRTRPLIDGSVQAEGLDLTVLPLSTPERMFRMAQYEEFDICESSSAIFLAARARGRKWTAIPVFPHRRFRHSYVFVNGEAGIREPRDLAGRRVGVAIYMNSAALWVRGVLQHEYGVPLESMTCVPPTLTECGVMSPIAFSVTSAYGTLPIVWRGDISGSSLTFTPRWRALPSNTWPSGVTSPSFAEK